MRDSLLDRLLMVSSLFQRDMAREFAGTPLTEARLALLWALLQQGPSTQQSLSDALSVTPRNISGLVDALEKHGYVQRAEHPTDRRAVLVRLTGSGEVMMRRMGAEHAALEDELRAAIAPEDLAGFEQGLDAVIGRLAALVDEASPAGEDLK